MNIFEKIKNKVGNKTNKEEYIQVLKDYVEGRMHINEVKYLIEHEDNFVELLKTKFNFEYRFYKDYDYNIYNYLLRECPFSSSWDTI